MGDVMFSNTRAFSLSRWGKTVTIAERFFPQAELRGLKVLPPHGARVTEAI